jgi:hypothetical protein
VIRLTPDRDAFLALGPAPDLDRPRFVSQQQRFVAVQDGTPRARCVARLAGSTGMIGMFEAADDRPAAHEVLTAAASWLRERGATVVVGPMDGDTWHRYRVNAGPFDVPPFLLEPLNAPWYDALWRSAGFEVIERYTSKRIEDIAPLGVKLERMHTRALSRGYTIRSFHPSRMRDELALVWRLSREIFRGNAWYSDIELEEFLDLYRGAEQLIVPELVLFAHDRVGDPVGFLFAYPDLDVRVVNYKTVGVVPPHRRGHLAWALLRQAYRAALAMGRPTANHCLMREENASQSMDAGEGVPFRHYYLYAYRG